MAPFSIQNRINRKEKNAIAQQLILPCIPLGATAINHHLGVINQENKWTYFLGCYPLYSHSSDDNRMFRLTTSQLIDVGLCRQIEILKTFGVSKSSVARSLKKYRQGGIDAFLEEPRKTRKGGRVLTDDVLAQAQELLNQGFSNGNVADELHVKRDTLRKAINDGRLSIKTPQPEGTTKSSRNTIDAQAAKCMGTACTRPEERTVAAFGVCDGAPVRFEPCIDVPKGGVLCALPALLMNGLLNGAERFFGTLSGYYRTFHILILVAFMALCRIKTVEQLRGHAPGEFGKLLGLDRIPEVRCLRSKLGELGSDAAIVEHWSAHLSKYWMVQDPQAAGTLYIDGHVRVYYGGLTKLPRKFVSRERLCLRGVNDFWVNDATGRPFFVVDKTVNPGMLAVLEQDIVPRLLEDVPNQPDDKDLVADPFLNRFVMVFDREGYSPQFFKKMWEEHRISCITYHKFPDDAWPEEWFKEQEVTMPSGEIVTMKLAEMGSFIGSKKSGLWVREVRKLTNSRHQTSLVSTSYDMEYQQLASCMFSRWCQENFFGYMMHHFAIDLLAEYGTEQLPANEQVVNPAWRQLVRERSSLQNKHRYRKVKFAEFSLSEPDANDKDVYNVWLSQKSSLLEEVEHYEHELSGVKERIKSTPKHIAWEELSEEDQFQQLSPGRKQLMDTIRMIAYRAETAMAGLIKGPTVDTPAARRILQDLFVTEADILPDADAKILTVRVHKGSRPAVNRALSLLFKRLNESEVIYPGTDMRISYELGGEGHP